MNEIAESIGYVIGTPKKDFEKARQEEIIRNLNTVREHIIESLGSGKKEKKLIGDVIDGFLKKYKKQFLSGEYALLTSEELVVIGKGSIVDEASGVIVWTKRRYISWDEMTEL